MLAFVFYKYLSDSYLVTAYDLLNDSKPNDLIEAQKEYEKIFDSEDAGELLEELKESLHYTLDPDMTFTYMLNEIEKKKFDRSKLQSAFNRIQESDKLFNDLFADVDLYSNRLGTSEAEHDY